MTASVAKRRRIVKTLPDRPESITSREISRKRLSPRKS